MSTLTQLLARLAVSLPNTTISATAVATEAVRKALEEYNQHAPRQTEGVITLPGDGREIALNGLADLLDVLDVWWPYDSDATNEQWPPNQVQGWRLFWDDGQPLLILSGVYQDQPQEDQEMRVWYTVPHTIDGLDSAAATTIPATHEGRLLQGAEGFAIDSQRVNRAGDITIDSAEWNILENTRKERLRDFRAWLEVLRKDNARRGSWPQSPGWQLDKFDGRAHEDVGRRGGWY